MPDGLARAVIAALRLARGEPVGALDEAEWSRVFDVSARERCAGLAWLRSAETIRAAAPATIARAWRTSVLLSEHRVQAHLEAARRALAALGAAGIESTVLKGPPLAQRLYGDVAARPVDDIDLFVAECARADAHRVLTRDGWRCESGVPPWHERWERGTTEEMLVLEVHSHLTCDNLAHLHLPPPERVCIDIGGHAYIAAGGDVVPVYLAGHLAQHELTPLLWFLDYGALWQSMTVAERDRATALARRVRMGRCLDWALDRVAALDRAAAGDESALALFGYRNGARSDVHALRRLLRLAERVDDAAHLIGVWAWPRAARAAGRSPLALFRARARKMLRGRAPISRSYSQ
ncbi:MAG: nucleotidyltransferase family protein [Gemmatimonadaceae bacterium]